MSRILTCEQVSDGHPDKICDQVADAKAQVSFGYSSGRITDFLCSVQHSPDVEVSYDLTPRGIINRLHLLDVDYKLVSSYGHFGNPGLSWEE